MSSNSALLSRLLTTERAALVRWLARMVGSVAAAEDVAQNLYLRVQSVKDDPPIINKRSFLFRLASNLALDHLRAARRQAALFVEEADGHGVPSPDPNAETRLLDQEKVRQIAAVVDTMPLRCRQVFVLVKIDELSVSEAAERLSISQDMVRKHIRHALVLCHRALSDAAEA